MGGSDPYTVIRVPREGVNEDVVRIVEWLVSEGKRVEAREPVAILETTKVTFDLEADRAGFLFLLAEAGAEVPVGAPIALVADRPERPVFSAVSSSASERMSEGQVITQKARAVIEQHGLPLELFAGLDVVRTSDVQEALRRRTAGGEVGPACWFRGEALDLEANWDTVLDSQLYRQVQELLTALRKRMKAKFHRHVPVGDLLYDRWELARDYGFGEGTSVYDECVILGDVQLGRHCWVGPYTILDGNNAPLKVGDFVDIAAGTHIYTHNTIERALTGRLAPLFKKATIIGNCSFIGPMVVVAAGTVIGDHSFVASGSYVEGIFPPYSFISGNPARRVGVVEIKDNRARIRPFPKHPKGGREEDST